MRAVILVPRRDGQVDRDLIWGWVRRWWRDHLPEFEIFEGHHDDGPFSRSAAVNRASGAADWQRPEPWDVAVIIDSDVICDADHVRAAVDKAVETGRMVLPFDIRKDVDRRGARAIMDGDTGNWHRYVHKTYTEMVSGVVVVTRRLWGDVGGFDESFVAWGREDNAWAAACETFGEGPIIKLPGELWHLYHATARDGRPGTAAHARNKARADLYLAARGDKEATRAIQRTTVPVYVPERGIPKILHRVVPEKTTPEVERWWQRFGDLHPDWELRTHRDPLDPADWPETRAKWDDCANGAQFADLIRLECLLRDGGVYVDSDCEPLRALDPLLPLQAFAAWEDERCVPNAVMGAVPGHPAIRACLELALSRIPGDTWKAGPGVTTGILPGRVDVTLFGPEMFYGVYYRDPDRDRLMSDPTFGRRHPWAYLLHHYHGSWLVKPEAVA